MRKLLALAVIFIASCGTQDQTQDKYNSLTREEVLQRALQADFSTDWTDVCDQSTEDVLDRFDQLVNDHSVYTKFKNLGFHARYDNANTFLKHVFSALGIENRSGFPNIDFSSVDGMNAFVSQFSKRPPNEPYSLGNASLGAGDILFTARGNFGLPLPDVGVAAPVASVLSNPTVKLLYSSLVGLLTFFSPDKRLLEEYHRLDVQARIYVLLSDPFVAGNGDIVADVATIDYTIGKGRYLVALYADPVSGDLEYFDRDRTLNSNMPINEFIKDADTGELAGVNFVLSNPVLDWVRKSEICNHCRDQKFCTSKWQRCMKNQKENFKDFSLVQNLIESGQCMAKCFDTKQFPSCEATVSCIHEFNMNAEEYLSKHEQSRGTERYDFCENPSKASEGAGTSVPPGEPNQNNSGGTQGPYFNPFGHIGGPFGGGGFGGGPAGMPEDCTDPTTSGCENPGTTPGGGKDEPNQA